ncbi:MAG: hypothetical protein LBB86_01935 [Oscillospiraceae bacterium]|jgi:hypothetical protein|nr:hypothetical protein [Oscillospiraceae bacterium]
MQLRDAASCYNAVVNAAATASPDAKLTFEWYSIIRELDAFFKDDINVSVQADPSQTSDNFSVTLNVSSPCIAGALATVLNLVYDLGNVKGTVHVVSGGLEYREQPVANLNDLLQWAQVAFVGNPRVKGYTPQTLPPPFEQQDIAIIVEKAAIQYYDDDLSELYSNTTKTTEDVLNELLSQYYVNQGSLRATTEYAPDTDWGAPAKSSRR